ncbi:MAG: cupin domain-containing protein [Candidatus Omnitrophica bacterium]|nr:cupin domain-containing protein [Candidatus Omnitrophota bacterium]
MAKSKPILVTLKGQEKFTRILSGFPETMGIKSGHVVLKPGENVGEHVTEAKEEVIVVLKGKAMILCGNDDEPIVASARTVVYVPPETTHDVKNIGGDILEYIYVTAAV